MCLKLKRIAIFCSLLKFIAGNKQLLCGFEVKEEILYQISKSTQCKELFLKEQEIREVEPNAFKGSGNLTELNLKQNKICSLQTGTFKYLSSLVCLDLSFNCLETLSNTSFLGLKMLEKLILISNKIYSLERGSFEPLTSLKFLNLLFNKLQEIYCDLFEDMMSGIEINLSFNRIQTCAFAHVNLTKLSLNQNILKIVHKDMFVGLTNLIKLLLDSNKIEMIECGAFKDLRDLTYLSLSNNKLTYISKNLFRGPINLQHLQLKNNVIHMIESGFVTLPLNGKLTAGFWNNKISQLSWNLFINSSSALRAFVEIDLTKFKCTRSICWMEHLEWKIFEPSRIGFHVIHRRWSKHLQDKCEEHLKNTCPSKATWCMDGNSTKCETQCLDMGYIGGKLVIDGDVCAAQSYCQCICSDCEKKCELWRQVCVNKHIDIFGCVIGKCQCKQLNCMKTCNGSDFLQETNSFGCPQCKCRCNDVDCDVECKGRGYGIFQKDNNNCTVCKGCSDDSYNENGKQLGYVIGAVSFPLICLICTWIIYLCKRQHTPRAEHLKDIVKFVTLMDTLIQNLDPKLAQKVKENWFDPKTYCVNQLLGNGHFGIVWSGIFEPSPGRKFPAAIKVAKAEYKDVWTVETRWNCQQELKPHFEKRRVQVQLENQITEDILKEALIMKKFYHPNVLHMYGVSIHEEKPCIILPLMSNGDLKKYLKANKSILTNQNMTAFALGVAKGMTHLADQKFVHCDLAARNCMLDHNLVVKISDFGSATDIQDKTYHTEADKPMPIRWMSLEAIKLKIFTLESDVWSYGVVLFEIFSYGELPYVNIDNMDILKYLTAGHRLEKPKMCPDNMYEIMQKCFLEDETERPTFNEILDVINRIADKAADYTEVRDESASTNKD